MTGVTEEYVNSRLQLMKEGVLYRNGTIRFDSAIAGLSDEDMTLLREEMALVSSQGIILNIAIDEEGSPTLRLSNAASSISSRFENSVFEKHRETILKNAEAMYRLREDALFPKTARRLKREGFTLERLADKQGYVVAGDDKDYGFRIIHNCQLKTALSAVEALRAEFEGVMADHFANVDYIALDALNFKLVRRELMSEGKLDYTSKKRVRVRTMSGEIAYVTLDKKTFALRAVVGDKEKQVVEKDSDGHLRAIKYALAMQGLTAEKISNGYNIYRGGILHKPLLEGLQSATAITKAIILRDRALAQKS